LRFCEVKYEDIVDAKVKMVEKEGTNSILKRKLENEKIGKKVKLKAKVL
jgi:hypothetical protein